LAGATDVTFGAALIVLAAIRLARRAGMAWHGMAEPGQRRARHGSGRRPLCSGYAEIAQRAVLNDVLTGFLVIMLAGVSWLVDRPGHQVSEAGGSTAPRASRREG
jgi:hypothetical protein